MPAFKLELKGENVNPQPFKSGTFMPIVSSPLEFHKSVTEEIKSVQNRVRNLIGDVHWGQDGVYKEAILRNVIKKFLTPDLFVGTGFVVTKSQDSLITTSQIDILIVSREYPVLFSEGDFIITTPINVKAVIEVKTMLNSNKSAADVINKANQNAELIGYGNGVFNGIFAFDTDTRSFDNENFDNALSESKGNVNHLCLGENYFIKYWEQNSSNPVQNAYRFYNIKKLAFTYFMFNLVEHIYPNTSIERDWFLFPLSEGKEPYGFKNVNCS